MDQKELIARDLRHIWHPCSQMKDFEQCPPLPLQQAKGSFLYTLDGRPVIDAISSWWCKSLGHAHPKLQHALSQQLKRMEHVILANTTHETVVHLGETLAALSAHWAQPLDKVLFASDGSCAVEIALKMSLHLRHLQQQTERSHLAALQNAYHGETLLTLAVSDLQQYKAPYQAWMPQATFVQHLPYVNTSADPLWQNCEKTWPLIEQQLTPLANTLTALIVEPLLQGAAGMRLYSADLLKRLSRWCQQNQVHLIADEILTGLGRTGSPLACDQAGIEPDFICLAKNLTAGMLPMSACLTSSPIYQHFYDDYATAKAFMHSHTHSGNALAAAVANATLALMQEEDYYGQARDLGDYLKTLMDSVAEKTGVLHSVRQLGAVVAADFIESPELPPRMGYQVYQQALAMGALLRPLGNTFYWLPPLNTPRSVLDQLHDISVKAIQTVLHTCRTIYLT